MLSLRKMSPTEREIMGLIWKMEPPVIASEVLKKAEDHDWNYTTMATFMQKLCQKGLLRAVKKGNTNLYYPEVTEEGYKSFETHDFIKSVHGGSLQSFFSALCADVPESGLSRNQIQTLKEMLDKL